MNMRKVIVSVLLISFFSHCVLVDASELLLPPPGQMVALSTAFNPPVLKGIKVYPDNPLRFDFILDKGDDKSTDDQIKVDSIRLIKYFLASLTIPEKDLWVNLSPYEKDRIVPEAFGQTEMGRDLLAQDYLLKQITSSLLYPEGETGKRFWKKIYALAQERYGTTDIPVDTFNKVWIVPEKAVVYENGNVGAAYITESHLKVMLETDYLATSNNALPTGGHDALLGNVSPSPLPSEIGLKVKATQGDSQQPNHTENDIVKSVLREVVIPVLEQEVNRGKNFAQLRQVYQSLILATWYKKKIKQSLLSAVYVDQKKIDGVNIADFKEADKIWGQYAEAFKKGAYSYIQEDRDAFISQAIPRKYFSGGLNMAMAGAYGATDFAELSDIRSGRVAIIQVRADPSMAASDGDRAQFLEKDDVRMFKDVVLQSEDGRRFRLYFDEQKGGLYEMKIFEVGLDGKMLLRKSIGSLYIEPYEGVYRDRAGRLQFSILAMGLRDARLEGKGIFSSFFRALPERTRIEVVDVVNTPTIRFIGTYVFLSLMQNGVDRRILSNYYSRFNSAGDMHEVIRLIDESLVSFGANFTWDDVLPDTVLGKLFQDGHFYIDRVRVWKNPARNSMFQVDILINNAGVPARLPEDKVVARTDFDNGGIDFSSGRIHLYEKNGGGNIQFNLDPAQLQQMQNATGFAPVIIGIQPMNDLMLFLGQKPPQATHIGAG